VASKTAYPVIEIIDDDEDDVGTLGVSRSAVCASDKHQ